MNPPTVLDPIRLVVIKNPFDRRERDERLIAAPSAPTIETLIGEYLPAGCGDGTELVVSVNGEVVPQELWATRTISQGDQMIAMPVVGKGGGLLGAVLSIGLMVVAPGIGEAIAASMGMEAAGAGLLGTIGGYSLTVGGIIGFGVSMVGSALIGALTAPDQPNLPSTIGATPSGNYDSSPSYAWQPVTTQEPGGVIARAYGSVKLHGNIIAGYIENTGDTGRVQTAHMLIDLGMGPYSSLTDFKINGQPLNYYTGVTATERRGNMNQDIIPAFNDTRITRGIGSKVVNGTPVVRNTVGNDFDALEIVLTCPQGLWHSNDSGGMDAVSVQVQVELSADGGATWQTITLVASGGTTLGASGRWSMGQWIAQYDENGDYTGDIWLETSAGSSARAAHTEGEVSGYDFWRWLDIAGLQAIGISNAIILTGSGTQPIRKTLRVDNLTRGVTYKVRVSNDSADQTTSRYGDDLYLAEINEVLYDDFTYPRTVLVGIDAIATDQLSGGIQFECLADAAIVRVWNGSAWSSAFSRNPAWVAWDILTQPVFDNSWNVARYDGRDPSTLILADFSSWAQWCDEAVPVAGGTEPRCVFDGIYDTMASVWDSALEVAASARAILLMRGTSVTVVYDHVRTLPAQVFSVGNTLVSSFQETFLPMADRASGIEVDYLDAAQDHARDKLTIVNADVTEASAQHAQFANRGIRRASQAWREAMFRLKRNELLRRSAQIGVDIDALACTVGDLIWVQDDVTQWGEGGRIVSGTTTSLALDKSITLAVGKTYDVVLRMADDTIATRAITTAAGTVSSITVGSAFPATPAAYDVWAVGETGKAVKEFIATDIRRDGDQRATISLIEYNASLYNVDSGAATVPTADVSAAVVPAIRNLRSVEVMELAADGTVLVHLDLYFDLTDASKGVAYSGGAKIGESITGKIRYANVTSGATYTVQVRPVTALGTQGSPSNWQSITTTILGKLAPPANVTQLSIAGTVLSWSAVGDIDLAGYRIRFQYGVNTEWGTANALHTGLVTSSGYTLLIVPPGQVTLMVRAVDTSGNESTASAYVITNFGDTPVVNVVESRDYRALGWPGDITGATIVGGDIAADQPDLFYKADASDFYGADTAAFYNTNYSGLEWISTGWTPSLAAAGSVMTITWTLTGEAQTVQYRPTGPSLFYGNDLDYFYGADADAFYDAAGDWMTWPGSLVAKNEEVQFRVATSAGGVAGLLSAFVVSVDVPDKVLALNGVVIGSGGSRLSGAVGEFNVIQNIQLTLQGGSTAMKVEASDYANALGPLVDAKNSSGTGVAATIDAFLQGY